MLRQSKGAPAWRAYVEFINNILIQGIALTVTNSLRFLLGMRDAAEEEPAAPIDVDEDEDSDDDLPPPYAPQPDDLEPVAYYR